MDFQFQPLELWRASSLAQETKAVIAAYERCLASNDMDGLASLRSAIEGRIDELDAFYTAHVDDERSILFDKQRLKLRKLLHEYDEAVRSMGAGGGYGSAASQQQQQWQQQAYLSTPSQQAAAAAAAAAQAAAQADLAGESSGMVTRQIREDSRLSLPELLSWFTQAGSAEMPEVSVPVVEKLYANVTRTNIDGRMSIRDLRQWYISYGKRALRSGVSSFDSEVVPAALVKQHKDGAGGAGGQRRRGSKDAGRTLYPWEQAEGGAGAAGVGSSGASSGLGALDSPLAGVAGGPLSLPNHMLEFQIRMSESEYAAFAARRRMYEAELRYKERIAKGQQARQAAQAGTVGGKGTGVGEDGGFGEASSYRDPVSASSYSYRQ